MADRINYPPIISRIPSNGLATLDRADEDVSITAFHARTRLDCAERRQVFGKTNQQLFSELRVSDLPAAELHHSLDAIALFQESHGVVLLEFVVVVVGIGPELQFFDLHDVLLLLSFV